MKPIKHINPIITEIGGNRVVLSKSVFNDIIKQINLLTNTINTLADNQVETDNKIVKVAQALDTLQ